MFKGLRLLGLGFTIKSFKVWDAGLRLEVIISPMDFSIWGYLGQVNT